MSRCYVFGYGSLMTPWSVRESIPIEYNHGAYPWQIVTIAGFVRDFGLQCQGMRWLDIQPNDGAVVGSLIPISNHNWLTKLDIREIAYKRTVVNPGSINEAVDAPVFTYIGKSCYRGCECVVTDSYLECVADGVLEAGVSVGFYNTTSFDDSTRSRMTRLLGLKN